MKFVWKKKKVGNVTSSEIKPDQSPFLILHVIVYEQKQSLEWQ